MARVLDDVMMSTFSNRALDRLILGLLHHWHVAGGRLEGCLKQGQGQQQGGGQDEEQQHHHQQQGGLGQGQQQQANEMPHKTVAFGAQGTDASAAGSASKTCSTPTVIQVGLPWVAEEQAAHSAHTQSMQ